MPRQPLASSGLSPIDETLENPTPERDERSEPTLAQLNQRLNSFAAEFDEVKKLLTQLSMSNSIHNHETLHSPFSAPPQNIQSPPVYPYMFSPRPVLSTLPPLTPPAYSFTPQLSSLLSPRTSQNFHQYESSSSYIPTSLPHIHTTPIPQQHNIYHQPPDTYHIPTPKLKLHCFEGIDPLDWIFHANQYFQLLRIPNERRLEMVSCFLKGEALAWFQWLFANRQLTTWENFLRALELRFGPSAFANHRAALFQL